MTHQVPVGNVKKTWPTPMHAKEALDKLRADPRSYLHFVTHDVVKHFLRPYVTSETVVVYYDGGQPLCETHFLDGKLHGCVRQWYENGQLEEERHYIDDKLHGLEQRWTYRGMLYSTRWWENGKPHGVWYAWYPNGALRYEECYVEGSLHWNREGDVWGGLGPKIMHC